MKESSTAGQKYLNKGKTVGLKRELSCTKGFVEHSVKSRKAIVDEIVYLNLVESNSAFNSTL